MLYLWLGAERTTAQLINSSNPRMLRVTLASRGNTASKNFWQETSKQKCCLYEAPYITAPIRETGVIIARTPPYAQVPTDTPTRARFFWFTSDVFHKRPILLKDWLLRPFSMRKSKEKAVPRKDYFMRLRSPAKSTSSVSAWILCSDVTSWARASRYPLQRIL